MKVGIRERLVEAGGVEPPSEDSLLRAPTCVSGHLGLVLRDPGRQGSRRTIPVSVSPFLPPGGGLKAIPLRRRPSAYTGNRRSDVRGCLGRVGVAIVVGDYVVPAFYEVRGASARNPGASTSPSKPFRPLGYQDTTVFPIDKHRSVTEFAKTCNIPGI